MEIKTVYTENAPAPAGHYSQAVVYHGLVYVAGQVAIDPQTGERQLGSIEEQTERTLRNVEAILQAAGSDFRRVYIADISLWAAVNTVYARILGDHRPARAIIPTRDLHHGFLIEIDAIAAVSS